MPQINTYEDIEIKVLSQTEDSGAMRLACNVTQKKDIAFIASMTGMLAKYLIAAEHTSVFEHASMTFLASGISRSLLAQVTRQRHFSFTSASQHYQDYRDYPMSLRPGWDTLPKIRQEYELALEQSLEHYIKLIELGEKPEEARQVLPNACTVNLVITANPRALIEFLRIRLCKRNTKEMITFAERLHIVCKAWLPEVFTYVDEPCVMDSVCNQGKMSCRL